ncbi:aminotransferase class IV family protein [Aliarcobacter butzleri]|uniref:aminotransferase class IV family protein n=1 Tax=Aliarcobacter butzleri TaxID=28197 RepID=UPI0021B24A7D|nr:aminotransferase class IV family protein [Aliarcobacter butzleri]MCT7564276.1 aminotransferase class IV family protein [Aliarcobacter butzleri]MCT7565936.1 aminotransferase class IV family protein [Aliarcobacter butzleri]MCT7570192.1 aminotransferase class IV family protein [Aliarcobacter butzleri]MCT7613324.1 aminotransferase class IV family protein [Aliarcobacter butzleri]MCT7631936.1 aminotransferase class IV family protein [Aliarcobacter butzleri]
MESIKYFETIKCEDFEVFNLNYHQKRVANTIGLNINLQEYINPISEELLRCKLIYDENGVVDVLYFPYKKREIKSFKIIFDNEIEYSKKYLNRAKLDELYEKKDDCDEVIIIKNEIVTDTTIANIAIFYENSWITSKNCLLGGTTRARLLEEKKLFEKDITLDMLKNASKVALMNAMIGFDEIKDFKIKEEI